jgi:dihydrofolate reductase
MPDNPPPKISIIVAIAQNYAIGKDNQLLWHLSEDLKRFKRITNGSIIIMGRNTYLSLPKRPLPNRINVVISDVPDDYFEGAETVGSIEQALEYCSAEKESFIIGGGSIYRQFMPLATKLYITKVHKDFEADTFFPDIDDEEWELVEESDVQVDKNNSLQYSFLTYRRK